MEGYLARVKAMKQLFPEFELQQIPQEHNGIVDLHTRPYNNKGQSPESIKSR